MKKWGLILFFFFWYPLSVQALGLELPVVSGWQASPPQFLHYQGGFGKAFYIARTYTNGEASIQVFLAGGPEGEKFSHLLSDRLEISTKDYYLKYIQDGPFRCLVSYTPPEKRGFMAVFLSKKPVVILFARYQGLTDKELYQWLKGFDWEKLRQKSIAVLGNE